MTRENAKYTLTNGITSHAHYLYLNIECKTQLNKITIISHGFYNYIYRNTYCYNSGIIKEHYWVYECKLLMVAVSISAKYVFSIKLRQR